ncbi:MAG: hypothetical protein DSO09_01865 [Candidatus Methanomethylicota archaeon]|uniref:Type II secretion system protein GspF domain-containing protein n=1 Tax=Thermoproteota archaeon TaxID=2056631 RepID=A0A520KF05_9CREN|nr:MAG: hypothetical protein EF809_04355 [Candidatus Verstraetearchaeota archaeon]TDA39715.1 MAG: hypothetical protein DSO09_01865 [Candidatus Verstraetearchaeota archaeon]
MERKLKIVILSIVISLLSILSFLLLQINISYAYYALIIGIIIPIIYSIIALKRRQRGKLDVRLVMMILHMYVVSLGEAGTDKLIDTIANFQEYGTYSKVFAYIKKLAKDFGYGFSKAILHVSKTVKSPFRDILIRLSEAFSSAKPKGYFELEYSTIMEEYSGFYTRMLESLRLLGGMFSTFQSVSVFIVMTVSILTIFIVDERVVPIAYLIAIFSTVIMFFSFRMVTIRDPIVYKGRSPPRSYKIFRMLFLLTLALIPSAIIIALFMGIPYGLISIGFILILPGIAAHRLESYVNSIDENYPAFLKALGESLSSTSDIKSALEYVLYMELGTLKELIAKLLARIKIGIDSEVAFNFLASESASYKVYTFNKIFLDAFRGGSSAIDTGKILGNSLIRFLEFRKKRIATSKSFEGVVLILQPITVALLVVMSNLCRFFSSLIISLPYFTFGKIPLDIINIGNIVLILLITILNSFAIMEARGGFWGSSLLYAGILFIVSGAVWLGSEMLVNQIFGGIEGIGI